MKITANLFWKILDKKTWRVLFR